VSTVDLPSAVPSCAADPRPDHRTAREATRAVLHHLRPDRRGALALTAAVAAATALPLAAPQFTGRLVDDARRGAGTGLLVLLACGYLAAAVAGLGARLLTAWLAGRLAWDGTNRLRERLAEHALGLDLGYHGRHTAGELIQRVDGDVAAIADFVVAFLLDAVGSGLLLAGMLLVVTVVDPLVGGVLLVFYALVGVAVLRAQRLAVPYEAASRAAAAAVLGSVEEWLAGAEDLRANGAGRHIVRRLWERTNAWFRADHQGSFIGSGLLSGTMVAFAAGTAIMLGMAAWAQQSGRITVGQTVLLFQYTLMVRTPFEQLLDQVRQYQAALAGVARVGELLAQRPALPQPTEPRGLPAHGALAVSFDGVAFAYEDDDVRVLSDIDITLEPGEKLGLAGRTGSGKTTLARLLLRLYDPTEGAVRVGGVDLREADPGSLRRRVCIVTQDVQLFAASVRDNLTLFRPDAADDARLRAVLDEVGLGDWLARLPDGLDSELGGVSAGQAQLLAFARAFLADPGLVVLDEASSRLDPATERAIERSVDRLLAGRTGVLIAHRLSALERVDKIAVVGDGRIVEYGPREALAADPRSRYAGLLRAAGLVAGGVR
jgi:ATP-binding cassette subfamily B protein